MMQYNINSRGLMIPVDTAVSCCTFDGFYNFPFKVFNDLDNSLKTFKPKYVMCALNWHQRGYEKYLLEAGFTRVSSIINPNSNVQIAFYILKTKNYKPVAFPKEMEDEYHAEIERIRKLDEEWKARWGVKTKSATV